MPPARGSRETLSLALPPADVPDDSAGSGAEGRARKRLQRTTNGNRSYPARQSSVMPPPSLPRTQAPTTEQKGGIMNRRRSTLREHQTPLGPRPLEHSNSVRRVTSDHQSNHTSAPNKSFLPTATSESNLTQASRANNPRFSFSKQSDPARNRTESSGSFDFLPQVNFDDFHASLTAPFEPQLSDFPAPGGNGGVLNSVHAPRTSSKASTGRSVSGEQSDTSETGRPKPYARRLSAFPRPPPQRTLDNSSSMPPPSAPLSARTRRQSQFPPPPPTNPAARPPRKSVGPGLLTSVSSRDETSTQIPGTALTEGQPKLGRTFSNGKANRHSFLNRAPPAQEPPSYAQLPPQPQRLSIASRSAKAKSLQPPPRDGPAPELRDDLSIRTAPKSPNPTKDSTPSSTSSKRQSVMPSHASGLGARTISPTDTMRMRRMSMMPQVPPIPPSPSMPMPEPLSATSSTTLSPSFPAPPKKDSAPPSARNTPDPNRKSVGPGLSLSHSSSYNSLRNIATGGSRSSQILSGSRLPTPKPRNVHSSAGDEDEDEEEEVPPVPAIPKAYESPKDATGSGWHPPRKSSQSYDPSTWAGQEAPPTSQPGSGPDPSKAEPSPTEKRKPNVLQRHRRGNTIGDGPDESKTQPSAPVNKRNLQPLRLPPLNLLPLSTPTNSRIASFSGPPTSVGERAVTPPPKRGFNKTPSTPMTASKASFFHRSQDEDDFSSKPPMRSSSSHYSLRPLNTSTSTSNDSTFASVSSAAAQKRQTMTPFSSHSLPKHYFNFDNFQTPRAAEQQTADVDAEPQSAKSVGSRTNVLKKDNASIKTSTSDEPETPSSGTSLRRKLSLSWKRSSSKASHVSQSQKDQNDDASVPQPPKHSDMPPPKLPASATWNGSSLSLGNSSPVSKPRGSFDFRRRKPSASAIVSDNETERTSSRRPPPNNGPTQTPKTDQSASAAKAPASSGGPMQRLLGTKNSHGTLKARNLDIILDKEDRAADEEMKRLTSKRKDFEAAAREVDELRKKARPNERVSPTQALQLVTLNIFERGEIIDYKEVYFCGTKSAKKHVGDLNSTSANFGYDDERGDYNIVLGDHLAYRYEVVDLLGKGSFGQVVRCVDHKTGGLVAVKIIRNKKRFHQQALVEVNILQKLQDWDPDHKHSMIKFTQSFYFRGHLCISTELLGMNLYEFIKAFEFRGFSVRLIRRFTRQMLNALVLLQSRRVIHCDLKPENILLAHPLHSEIKVIDFGSSCFDNEKVYTYIQSRFYRSPEVILGMSYGLPIDMWSLGCILAELLTGYPVFPGENEQEQLACIMEIFGPPEKHLIDKSSRKKLFFDSLGKPRVTVSSKGRRRRPSSKTLQQALKCEDEAFLDFISRCLRWDPERRMKPDEALQHEFITCSRKPAMSKYGNAANRVPRSQTNGATAGPPGATTGSAASSSAGNSSAAPSPMKRVVGSSSLQTPQRSATGPRPLPDPPATSFRNGTAVREGVSTSPVKAGGSLPRRHSTVHAIGSSVGSLTGMKRASNGAIIAGAVGSSLPRAAGGAAQRSASGKPDLASSAAAAATLKSR